MVMKIDHTQTPVVILNCKIGGLAILRSLGRLGVPIYGIDDDPGSPVMRSRYFKKKLYKRFDENEQEDYLHFVVELGKTIGKKSLLIPTSDELAVFVAENSGELRNYFLFPDFDGQLAKDLISKKEMFAIATRQNIPTPSTLFPRHADEVVEFADRIDFPVMLKGIHGNRLFARTGYKMALAHNRKELLKKYEELEDPQSPNLMLQEHIPGGDDQVYIFNGYFNHNSECLSAFTGHKIRQAPIHFGCASLGICKWNSEVSDITTKFMKDIGYRGVLDIGYRLDPRDGKYKVLDINPRVGGAFRIFVAQNGMDAVRSLYLDQTGQPQLPIVPREGRRWIYEDFDLVSSYEYYQEGTLNLTEWIRSLKGVEEGAWFSWRDPLPFVMMAFNFSKRFIKGIVKKPSAIQRNSTKQQAT